eukprot:scaffold68308_cov19-Tisochrysis_lutea.AAC.1
MQVQDFTRSSSRLKVGMRSGTSKIKIDIGQNEISTSNYIAYAARQGMQAHPVTGPSEATGRPGQPSSAAALLGSGTGALSSTAAWLRPSRPRLWPGLRWSADCRALAKSWVSWMAVCGCAAHTNGLARSDHG